MFSYDDLGPMIATARDDLSLTQENLAALATTSLEAIAKIEASAPGPITAEELIRVLHNVGLDIRVVPIPGPRPTFDDLRGNTIVSDRERLFLSWLESATKSPPSGD